MIDKKRKALTKDYDADFDNKLKTFNKTLEEIPIFWYDECVKRGYINEWSIGEKEALWEEAQQMALNAVNQFEDLMGAGADLSELKDRTSKAAQNKK